MCYAHKGQEDNLDFPGTRVLGDCEPPRGMQVLGLEPKSSGRAASFLTIKFSLHLPCKFGNLSLGFRRGFPGWKMTIEFGMKGGFALCQLPGCIHALCFTVWFCSRGKDIREKQKMHRSVGLHRAPSNL
jgi:hypothetical protein